MRRPAFYSRSPREPRLAVPAHVPDASGAPAPDAPLAAASATPTPRWQPDRHGFALLLALILCLTAAGVAMWPQAGRQLTQKDIDAAVLHTMQTVTLPSPAAKAAEIIRPSVVRVVSYGAEKRPAPDSKAKARAGKPALFEHRIKARTEKHAFENKTKARIEKHARNTPTPTPRSLPGKAGGKKPDASDKADSKADKSDKPGEPEELGVGTGVVIVDKGLILTSLHVVAGADSIKITFADGLEAPAKLVSAQPENDLAVLQALKLPDDLIPATMSSTADLQPGDQVAVVGFPFGIGPSVSAGVVSGLKRSFMSPEGKRELSNLIQFDAAANPGNSGGPLVNMDGEVLGIVTAILNPTQQRTFIGIGFAMPIENAATAVGSSPF
jgi:S1-C subfamily serine protease